VQSHTSDPRVLNRRTLERDHRRLLDLLQPGMSVLDVGCGTGAITAGIARRVGPQGNVLGVDRDEALLAFARQAHSGLHNLSFEHGDALSLPFECRFDIVTAARTLQWIGQPDQAIARMSKAAKPNGRVVVLDYNHQNNSWEPEPPAEFRAFYQAFLDWRKANNWDNLMADHLPALFRSAGMLAVRAFLDDEVVQRGDAEFFEATAIWSHVMENVGSHIVAAGFIDERACVEAEQCYTEWVRTTLQGQTLSMSTVDGVAPSALRPK
jgi:ubiquinone/menaquinone biosynthesis C-methylase UbiE